MVSIRMRRMSSRSSRRAAEESTSTHAEQARRPVSGLLALLPLTVEESWKRASFEGKIRSRAPRASFLQSRRFEILFAAQRFVPGSAAR